MAQANRHILGALALHFGALAMPVAASAHPHVFVDTGIEAVVGPDGTISGLRITWTYDELYTLLTFEDFGLDPDADGILSDAETAALQGFDMHWVDGYDGGMHLLLGDVAQALGPPQEATATVADGMITTTHFRPLVVPIRPGVDQPLIIQNYDPEYYVAYTVIAGQVSGDAACAAVIYGFDPAAADAALTAASDEYAGSDDPNAAFPKIGAAYSDEVRIACQSE